MFDEIARFFLLFSQDTFIIPIIIWGYIWRSRKTFFHALCLVFLSMIVNAALKVTFQIPLPDWMNKPTVFAFPSGHTQTCVVFYGWLYKTLQHKVRHIFPLCVLGSVWGIMYFGYHNIIDVIGALVVGLVLLQSYHYIWRHKTERYVYVVAFIISTICMVYTHIVYSIYPHLWASYIALIGLTIIDALQYNKEFPHNTKLRLCLTCLAFAIICFVMFGINDALLPVLAPLKWFLAGASLPLCLWVAHRYQNV